ncbi:MAG TPA: PIN domain-containing protein [Candidatus Norongarragalinales archaeon]|jgi:predicted nucleic acid-binding protein|nr:PIN domain-containing protein [Candidatus Norongarragalinales archaeon]
MLIVDSNVFIAYLNEHDQLHGAALRLDLGEAVTNQLVFNEVANVIAKKVQNKVAAIAQLKELLSSTTILALTDSEMRGSFEMFSHHHAKLSFTDCSLAVQSKNHGAKLVTFDKELEKAATR